MNGFERAIIGEMSVAEAASCLLQLKKFAAAPDETGQLEGKFTAPLDAVKRLMTEIVKNEFETVYAYHVYAQSLRDLSRDAIAEHFEEHADDELGHADFLLKRLSVLSGPVSVPDVKAPAASSDPEEIIKTMIRMEQEGIANWRKLAGLVGDDNPMKITIEDYAAQEQEHLDDLWQLLPHKKTAEDMQNMAAVDPYQQQMVGHQLLASKRLGGIGALAGAIPGAIGGATMGAHLGKLGPVGTAVSGIGGAALGAVPGIYHALKQQQAYEDLYNPEMKTAAKRIGLLRKIAFEGNPQAWLAQEQMLQQAQEQSEAEYFKAQAQAAQEQAQQKEQEMQSLQEQMQQAQQQMQEQQQQLDQSGQIQRQILDQARQVEQAATQTAASAHQNATASMLQAMQAQQEALRHKGLTANMHQNVQSWKDQLNQIVQADPTQGAGQQVGMPPSGPEAPAAMPPEEMVGAENAPPGQAPPGQMPAQGAAQQGATQQVPEQSAAPTAEMKVGHVKKALNAKTIGMLAGAPIGAGLGYLTSRMETPTGLLSKIQDLEGKKERKEESFREAVDLAKAKMQRDIIEAAQRHPVGGTIAGAMIGASSGAGIGAALPRMAANIHTIADNFRKVSKLPQ